MAHCPKCGKALRIYHWRPECPFCGVNMVYYNSNDRMLAETEAAEIEHAHNQPKIDRAKAAFFGSPAAISRIVLSAMPIGALFLPLGRLPSSPSAIHAIRIYRYLSDVGFKQAVGGGALGLSMLCLLVSIVFIFVGLACLPMSLGKHGKARNLIVDLLFLGFAAACAALFVGAGGKLLVGAFVYIALIAAILCYNLYLAKKGLPVKHTVCLIGGLPSEEYFRMKKEGVSELEIRKKMVEALTVMQEEVRAKEAREEAEALAKRAAHQ